MLQLLLIIGGDYFGKFLLEWWVCLRTWNVFEAISNLKMQADFLARFLLSTVRRKSICIRLQLPSTFKREMILATTGKRTRVNYLVDVHARHYTKGALDVHEFNVQKRNIFSYLVFCYSCIILSALQSGNFRTSNVIYWILISINSKDKRFYKR